MKKNIWTWVVALLVVMNTTAALTNYADEFGLTTTNLVATAINATTIRFGDLNRLFTTSASSSPTVCDSGCDYTSLQVALNNTPFYIRHNYYIYIKNGVYDENVTVPMTLVEHFVSGYTSESNKFYIIGNTTQPEEVKVASIAVSGSAGTQGLVITGITVYEESPYDNEHAGITIYGSSGNVLLNRVYINCSNLRTGVMTYNSKLLIENVTFYQYSGGTYNCSSYAYAGKSNAKITENGQYTDTNVGSHGSVVGKVYYAGQGVDVMYNSLSSTITGSSINSCDGGTIKDAIGSKYYCVRTFYETPLNVTGSITVGNDLTVYDDVGIYGTITNYDNSIFKNLTINRDIKNADDPTTFVRIANGNIVMEAAGVTEGFSLNTLGLRLGNAGARVTSITDSDSLGTSDTVLCTQGNVKAYVDTNTIKNNTDATIKNLKVGVTDTINNTDIVFQKSVETGGNMRNYVVKDESFIEYYSIQAAYAGLDYPRVLDIVSAGTATRGSYIRLLTNSYSSNVSNVGMVINPWGNVGINVSTPTSTLHVVGTANITSTANINGKLTMGTGASQINLTMTSPDGTEYNCGVANGGTFSCS